MIMEDSEEYPLPTKLLYLLPIFMGLLGGALMYIAVKDEDPEMANSGMFWTVISTIAITFIFYMLLLNMSKMNMIPLMN